MNREASTSGPLAGIRVVELCSELGVWAGRLLADMGADVILVEPPGGHYTRDFAPFVDNDPNPERSLWFWHYNANKRGITLDLGASADRSRLQRLMSRADIVIEAERPGTLASLGLDHEELRAASPALIWASITPFGQAGSRTMDEATDLTILAGGGPVWSSGYDDHTLPPVRGGGNQGYHTVCHFAVMSILAALVYRDFSGHGQYIDVSAHAAANVTTEAATYTWLVDHRTVQRQTGRHAATQTTQPTQIRCADGLYVNSGLATRPAQYPLLREWLEAEGLLDQFQSKAVLEWAIDEGITDIPAQDDATRAKLAAGRDAINLLAANMPAYDFFVGGQRRGFQVSIIYSPEEVLADPHMIARGFPVKIDHPEIDRSVTYPGVPIRFTASPMSIRRRAPLVGEHTAEVLAEYGAV